MLGSIQTFRIQDEKKALNCKNLLKEFSLICNNFQIRVSSDHVLIRGKFCWKFLTLKSLSQLEI